MNQAHKSQLLPLTSLRFVAASLIVIHHLKGQIWLPPNILEPFNFGTAVSFFFVLSGFVLYYSYHKRIGEIAWAKFAAIRFFRIWPLHIVILFISWIWLDTETFVYQLARLETGEIAAILILMQAWIPKDIVYFGLNSPSWSISTELFFYLSFPMLCCLLVRKLSGFVLGILLLTLIWLLLATKLIYNPEVELHAVGLAYINPLARLAEFTSGMIAAHLFLEFNLPKRAPKNYLLFTVLEFTLLAMAVLIGVISHLDSHLITVLVRPVFGPVVGIWISTNSGILVYPFIIVIFALGRGLLSKLLSNVFFVWLGTISFAVYLVHQNLIAYWKKVVSQHIESVPVSVFLLIITLVILSALLHTIVEKPGLRFAKILIFRKFGGQAE